MTSTLFRPHCRWRALAAAAPFLHKSLRERRRLAFRAMRHVCLLLCACTRDFFLCSTLLFAANAPQLFPATPSLRPSSQPAANLCRERRFPYVTAQGLASPHGAGTAQLTSPHLSADSCTTSKHHGPLAQRLRGTSRRSWKGGCRAAARGEWPNGPHRRRAPFMREPPFMRSEPAPGCRTQRSWEQTSKLPFRGSRSAAGPVETAGVGGVAKQGDKVPPLADSDVYKRLQARCQAAALRRARPLSCPFTPRRPAQAELARTTASVI